MKLRIVWLYFSLFFLMASCSSTGQSADQNGQKSPENVMMSELHGMNHTIRNFQDLLKRNPSAEAYAEYAEFLERRLNVVQTDFASEAENNADTKAFFTAVKEAIPGLKSKDESVRKSTQLKLNEANETAATKLKLN